MNVNEQIKEILDRRIMVIDGAMGTMIQQLKPTEEDYRGTRFADFPQSVKGNNDLLVLTQPAWIEQIHRDFLSAGADIIETNTFNANRVSMEDYNMVDLVDELNLEAARIARKAADDFTAKTPNKPRFVAGAMGPTNRTASISPEVNNPEFRSIDFDTLKACYSQQAKALIKGGVDILLVETSFDTLNAKAALFAINELKDDLEIDIPVMVSGTITDNSGRTLSGQTPEAFWYSVSHANVLSVGLNCALGADQMRPYIEEISKSTWAYVSCYPNAGLPNEFGEYDDTPEHMASVFREWCKAGLVNIVGGCCGTTPQHIKAIAEVAEGFLPRMPPVLKSVG